MTYIITHPNSVSSWLYSDIYCNGYSFPGLIPDLAPHSYFSSNSTISMFGTNFPAVSDYITYISSIHSSLPLDLFTISDSFEHIEDRPEFLL